MQQKTIAFILFVLLVSSCNKRKNTLTTVTGSKYEVLVVMNDSLWESTPGRSLRKILDRNMEGLPQGEAQMINTHCKRKDFSDPLKPSRNIILTQIASKYTQAKVIYSVNKWAQPQSVVLIQAANDSVFTQTIRSKGDHILNYFLRTERERQIEFNKSIINRKAKAEIKRLFGIEINITNSFSKSTRKKDFYWITNDNGTIRQDLIIYTYPFSDKKSITKAFILAKRDSVLKENIPGEIKGSYMGTEYNFIPPTFNEIELDESYCAEVRGLWKMIKGNAMGGPFYSQTRIDKKNQRIISIEGFVFAPGAKKRNPMRQLEAILYSTKLDTKTYYPEPSVTKKQLSTEDHRLTNKQDGNR